MKKTFLIAILVLITCSVKGQFTYGTTGLLNMPTADMQKDKTVLFGGGYLEKHVTPGRWFYDTYNYYINITFFPWMEFGYTCTLHKAVPNDPAYNGGLWVPSTYGKFVNQDRNFHIRFRIWKEGWWKWWTPQIVIGGNDVLNNSWTGGDKFKPISAISNGFNNRYYIAASKHFSLNNLGTLGTHLTYVYNERPDYKLNGLCIGINFRFKIEEEDSPINKIINGINLMLEAYPANGQGMYYAAQIIEKNHIKYKRGIHIDKYDINVGLCYSLWKDRISFYGELYGCKDFSSGLQLKIPLK